MKALRKTVSTLLACALFGAFPLLGAVGCENMESSCKITFDHNDGTGNVTVVTVPKGTALEAYAPVFVDGNRAITSWTTSKGEVYSGAVSKSIRLIGVWTEYQEETLSSYIPASISLFCSVLIS